MSTNVRAIRVKMADIAMMTSMDTHAIVPAATLTFTAKVTHILMQLVSIIVVIN